MRIVQDKAVALRVDRPKQITNAIKKSVHLDTGEVLVNWDIPEAQALNALGIKVPSPIRGRYDWPGMYKPFDHQRVTAEFLTLNKRAFCFNEQGTGKTMSAVWAADFLMKRGFVNRVLVVCPLSIMDSAWRADIFKVAMHRTVDIAYGTTAKRRKIINSPAEFIIINYDGIATVLDELVAGEFDLVIIDEATHYKTATTKRWKAMNKLVADGKIWLWMMTGTPAAQSPMDAYGIAKLLDPTNVPRYFGSFRDLVMEKRGPFKWIPRPTALEHVHKVLQPAIRFTKEECLDLPDMLYADRHVDMTLQQQVYYEKVRKEMMMEAAETTVTAVNAAVKMNKLLQIASGAVYADDGDVLRFDISKRYKVLKEVVDESSHKVLVFVPFRNTLAHLSELFVRDGIDAEIISGSVPPRARTDIFHRFQTTPKPRVLLIQPQSASHGVTLTAANTVVWWTPTASFETYAQANARVHRQGQVNKCTVVHLSSSAVERRLYRMLNERVDIHGRLVDLYKEILD